MPKRTRPIDDGMCERFADDARDLLFRIDTFIERHREFWRREWLGGDRDADNYEAPPDACAAAMQRVRDARQALADADHTIAMFRAGVDVDPGPCDDCLRARATVPLIVCCHVNTGGSAAPRRLP